MLRFTKWQAIQKLYIIIILASIPGWPTMLLWQHWNIGWFEIVNRIRVSINIPFEYIDRKWIRRAHYFVALYEYILVIRLEPLRAFWKKYHESTNFTSRVLYTIYGKRLISNFKEDV